MILPILITGGALQMNVLNNTADRLVLELTGWRDLTMTILAAGLTLGGCLVAIADLRTALLVAALPVAGTLIYGAATLERAQFWADRGTGTFTLRRRSLWRFAEDAHPLADLTRAIVTEMALARGGRAYRCAVQKRNGTTLALTRSHGAKVKADGTAAVINNWIAQGGKA
jgi:hypothetical protein